MVYKCVQNVSSLALLGCMGELYDVVKDLYTGLVETEEGFSFTTYVVIWLSRS